MTSITKLQFDYRSYVFGPQVLTLLKRDEIIEYAEIFHSELRQIYVDYFSTVSYGDFEENYVFNESLVMKCFAYRFANSEIMKLLRDRCVNAISSECSGSFSDDLKDAFIHPIFYARISNPGVSHSAEREKAFLDSQPHYDRAFGVYAYSFWLAINQANKDSGGLCFFSSNGKDMKHFHAGWGESNQYNYDGYLENYEQLDKAIKDKCIHPDIKAGQCYMFNSNVLHAATKPLSKKRASFDFRLIPSSELSAFGETPRKIILFFNENISLSNALNLFYLGDRKGALRVYPEIEQYIEENSLNVAPTFDILAAKHKLPWSMEYGWMR